MTGDATAALLADATGDLTLTVRIGRRDPLRLRVRDLPDASRAVQIIRDDLLRYGDSADWRDATVRDHGRAIARVSYNGRVWRPGPWRPGAVPLMEAYMIAPSAPHPALPFGVPYARAEFDDAGRYFEDCPVCGARFFATSRKDFESFRTGYPAHYVAESAPPPHLHCPDCGQDLETDGCPDHGNVAGLLAEHD